MQALSEASGGESGDEMDADEEIKSLREEIAQMKSLGYLDDDLDKDLRDLNTDLRKSTDLSSDKT